MTSETTLTYQVCVAPIIAMAGKDIPPGQSRGPVRGAEQFLAHAGQQQDQRELPVGEVDRQQVQQQERHRSDDHVAGRERPGTGRGVQQLVQVAALRSWIAVIRVQSARPVRCMVGVHGGGTDMGGSLWVLRSARWPPAPRGRQVHVRRTTRDPAAS
jgi:hypothetical protein